MKFLSVLVFVFLVCIERYEANSEQPLTPLIQQGSAAHAHQVTKHGQEFKKSGTVPMRNHNGITQPAAVDNIPKDVTHGQVPRTLPAGSLPIPENVAKIVNLPLLATGDPNLAVNVAPPPVRPQQQNPVPHTNVARHHQPGQPNAAPLRHNNPAPRPPPQQQSGGRSTTLTCDNTQKSYEISPRIQVEVGNSRTGFGNNQTCPCSYDINGKCNNAPHMCVASNTDYFCTYKMENFIVSKEGGIFEQDTLQQVKFNHVTIAGGFKPTYHDAIFSDWAKAVEVYKQKYRPIPNPPVYENVVPIRLRWDDCFNHLSFQTMPLVGAVMEFHGDKWSNLTWHSSKFSAAMLNLLDVPMEKIAVEKNILAKNIILPWVPHWCPVQIASLNGIANRLTEKLTANLLSRHFDERDGPLEKFNLEIPVAEIAKVTPADFLEKHMKDKKTRFLVYMSRTNDQARGVINQDEILNTIRTSITDEYQLVVLGHSVEYKTIHKLQQSWQRYARVVNRAVVFMGPHGGGWNNLMFTPPDCHFIEFNYQPNVAVYKEGTARIRDNFLGAAFAKGGSGRYYTIQPNNKTVEEKPILYYEGKMRVSPRDMLMVLQKIDAHVPELKLLKKGLKMPAW